MNECSFFVPGIPATGGSKRAFVNYKMGKMCVLDDCKRNGDWRAQVALAGKLAMKGQPPFAGPVSVWMEFILPRPKSHYGSGRNAGKVKPAFETLDHTSKPDVLKLARAAEDALTGICYCDDSQTSYMSLYKKWGEEPGVSISVLEEQP